MPRGASWLSWDLTGLWGCSGQQSRVLQVHHHVQCRGRHPCAGRGGSAHKDAVVQTCLLAWRDWSRAQRPHRGRPRCTRGPAVVPSWTGGVSSCATQRPSASCGLLARPCCRPQPQSHQGPQLCHLNHDPTTSKRHPIPSSQGPWHTEPRPHALATLQDVPPPSPQGQTSGLSACARPWTFPGRNVPRPGPRGASPARAFS